MVQFLTNLLFTLQALVEKRIALHGEMRDFVRDRSQQALKGPKGMAEVRPANGLWKALRWPHCAGKR